MRRRRLRKLKGLARRSCSRRCRSIRIVWSIGWACDGALRGMLLLLLRLMCLVWLGKGVLSSTWCLRGRLKWCQASVSRLTCRRRWRMVDSVSSCRRRSLRRITLPLLPRPIVQHRRQVHLVFLAVFLRKFLLFPNPTSYQSQDAQSDERAQSSAI